MLPSSKLSLFAHRIALARSGTAKNTLFLTFFEFFYPVFSPQDFAGTIQDFAGGPGISRERRRISRERPGILREWVRTSREPSGISREGRRLCGNEAGFRGRQPGFPGNEPGLCGSRSGFCGNNLAFHGERENFRVAYVFNPWLKIISSDCLFLKARLPAAAVDQSGVSRPARAIAGRRNRGWPSSLPARACACRDGN